MQTKTISQTYHSPSEQYLAATAHHEAGHAVATVIAFRSAAWLPNGPPPLPVKSVEVTEVKPGRWGGQCWGPDIYSTQWPDQRINEPFRELMEWRIVISLAGPIAETIHRGQHAKDLLMFAYDCCGADGDIRQINEVRRDLHKLTGQRHRIDDFGERTLALVRANFPAVEALASALIEHKRVEGERIEQIIDQVGGDQ